MPPTWGAVVAGEAAIQGPSERCIEVPLGLELLQPEQPGWVLDAGCALNGHLPDTAVASVVHLTQNIESEKALWHQGTRSYVCGDLRDLRIYASRAFDRVACLSTLEHVGFDNSAYGGPVEDSRDSYTNAMRELCRVADRRLIVSVPFYADGARCAKWQYFTHAMLGALVTIATAMEFACELRFYAKTAVGWYGGGLTPVPAHPDHFPNVVNAIAVLRCLRG